MKSVKVVVMHVDHLWLNHVMHAYDTCKIASTYLVLHFYKITLIDNFICYDFSVQNNQLSINLNLIVWYLNLSHISYHVYTIHGEHTV